MSASRDRLTRPALRHQCDQSQEENMSEKYMLYIYSLCDQSQEENISENEPTGVWEFHFGGTYM